MITEIILCIVLLILAITILVTQYLSGLERERMMKALIAKDLRDYTDNEALSKIKPTNKEAIPPEFIPIEDADDDLFHKAINNQLKNAEKLT